MKVRERTAKGGSGAALTPPRYTSLLAVPAFGTDAATRPQALVTFEHFVVTVV